MNNCILFIIIGAPTGIHNVARNTNGATCQASSSYLGYSCDSAINGLYGSGSAKEWASELEGSNAWIQIWFKTTYKIVGYKITMRGNVTEARVEFNKTGSETVRILRGQVNDSS